MYKSLHNHSQIIWIVSKRDKYDQKISHFWILSKPDK